MRRKNYNTNGDSAQPPAELADYHLWCANRGVDAYGTPGDETSMRRAAAQWIRWRGDRQVWADAHGEDESLMGDAGRDEPWDAAGI